MSEHPPIPGAAFEAAYEAYQDSPCVSIADSIRDALVAVAPLLWREWTRGMAVVPLPEPDERNGISSTWIVDKGKSVEITVTAYVADDGSPAIDSQDLYGELHMFSPDSGRAHSRAVLAACDRAEQLAAEANTEAGQP